MTPEEIKQLLKILMESKPNIGAQLALSPTNSGINLYAAPVLVHQHHYHNCTFQAGAIENMQRSKPTVAPIDETLEKTANEKKEAELMAERIALMKGTHDHSSRPTGKTSQSDNVQIPSLDSRDLPQKGTKHASITLPDVPALPSLMTDALNSSSNQQQSEPPKQPSDVGAVSGGLDSKDLNGSSNQQQSEPPKVPSNVGVRVGCQDSKDLNGSSNQQQSEPPKQPSGGGQVASNSCVKRDA